MNKYLVRRFFAFYIDGLILFPINMGIIAMFKPEHITYFMPVFWIMGFIYLVVCEYFWNITLGKKILKLKIIGYERGNKKKLIKQILIRNLVKFIPLDPFSIFLYNDYQMWHDMVSKTKVIDNY